MLAHENPVFDTVAQKLYKSNADEQIRYICQAREEYEFQMKRRQEQLEEYEFQVKHRQEQLEEYKKQAEDSIAANLKLQEENNRLRLEIQKLKGF